MKELNKERIIWIDYAKAIAMFFVIFGHVDSGNYLTNWIYSFHMPLFFLLSGAFCGARRTPMRFRADAVRSITDALNRLL